MKTDNQLGQIQDRAIFLKILSETINLLVKASRLFSSPFPHLIKLPPDSPGQITL